MTDPLSTIDLTPLAGRLAVVTGATRGIGWAVATELARHGVHVIAVGRKVEALEELDDALRAVGTAGTLVPLDMTDGQGVDRLGGSINDRWGKVDIVVGNAGVLGQISPLAHVKAPTWQETLDVNVTANWRLIRTLDPLLRRSDAGRCVFVTSGAVAKLRPFWGPYSVSKAALDALVKTYANETATTAVRANLFSPGAVRTAMRAAAVPGEDPDTLPTPADVAPSIAALCAPGMERSGATYSFRDRDFI